MGIKKRISKKNSFALLYLLDDEITFKINLTVLKQQKIQIWKTWKEKLYISAYTVCCSLAGIYLIRFPNFQRTSWPALTSTPARRTPRARPRSAGALPSRSPWPARCPWCRRPGCWRCWDRKEKGSEARGRQDNNAPHVINAFVIVGFRCLWRHFVSFFT